MKFSTVSIRDFRLAQVCKAPKHEVRYFLQGFMIKFHEGTNDPTALLVSTDGTRLCKSEPTISDLEIEEEQFDKEMIIDVDGVIPKLTTKLTFEINGSKGTVSVYTGKSPTRPIKVLPLTVIDATYPDWQQVLGSGNPLERKTIAFNPNLLADMATAVNSKTDMCSLTFQQDKYSPSKIGVLKVHFYNYNNADDTRIIRLMPGAM